MKFRGAVFSRFVFNVHDVHGIPENMILNKT